MARARMVVVGGDAAGMSAASQARKRRPAEELEIVAFERGPHTSYSACGLPYYAGGVVRDWHDLVPGARIVGAAAIVAAVAEGATPVALG